MNRSPKKQRQSTRNVIDALTYSSLLKLIVIIVAAFILVNYAKFTPDEVIKLVKSVIL